MMPSHVMLFPAVPALYVMVTTTTLLAFVAHKTGCVGDIVPVLYELSGLRPASTVNTFTEAPAAALGLIMMSHTNACEVIDADGGPAPPAQNVVPEVLSLRSLTLIVGALPLVVSCPCTRTRIAVFAPSSFAAIVNDVANAVSVVVITDAVSVSLEPRDLV